jgi:ribosomal protein S26
MAVDIVKCQFCGKSMPKTGIKNHERACSMNPDNMKDAEEVKVVADNEEADNEEINDTEDIKKQEVNVVVDAPTLVKIRAKYDINCFIGDTWYRIPKGAEREVPQNVKDILNRAEMLSTL